MYSLISRMDRSSTPRPSKLIDLLIVFVFFILGIWLVVLRPLGFHLQLVPGDLGDARFNNYILEHFFRFISGATKDYWNAPFFFPYQQTTAFSDTLLGSAPIYVLFRLIGLGRVSAFQGWYILAFVLDFTSASFILRRLKLQPLAIGIGAFFFTFGLPLLAQENHAQLLYCFCIPLACYALWRFYQFPRLKTLLILGVWLVWQVYLSIYIGIFLFFLLVILFILIPLFEAKLSIVQRLVCWPQRLIKAWYEATLRSRLLAISALIGLTICFIFLFLPYYDVSRLYGFTRSWVDVSAMLPRLQSYLIADNSQIWSSISNIFPSMSLRWEHQLFPGLAVILFILVGVIGRFQTENRRLAWINLTAALILLLLTLYTHGFSLYKFIYQLPGLGSLRAVTRIMLVMMWPIALFIAWVVDGFLQCYHQHRRWMQVLMYLLAGLLVLESTFYTHSTYDKAVAEQRLDTLRQQFPTAIPADPVLYIAQNPKDPWTTTEIDAMLLSQELGWSTINGYSGNFPPGYSSADSCQQLPAIIKQYMEFTGKTDVSFYLASMKRVVPIGFTDCNPSWWVKMP